MEERKHIVILAAGDFPTHEVPLRALREADFVVCCDSAWKSIQNSELRIQNYIVIGDGDSLTPEKKRHLGDRWIQVDEQDYNDLHKAMEWATAQFGIQNTVFQIVGATGKREDHTLGNISYLVTFGEEYPEAEIEMLTDYGRFVAFHGCRSFLSFPRQQVSIFTFSPDTVLHGLGLQYPIDGLRVNRWWQATLNSAIGNAFTINANDWTVVFCTYEPK